jgi:hypothetical protein
MINAFVPRLPSSLRRHGGSALPFSHIVERAQIYGFSVNFLRFPRFFERGALVKIIAFSFLLLRAFAPSREIKQASPRAVRVQGFTQRRKGEKRKTK